MDYPISVPSVGLVGGKFLDEDPFAGTPGSLIPAQWGNAVTDEILNVITGAGLPPDELNNTQLLAAIKAVILQAGVTPGRLIGFRLYDTAGTFTYIPTPGMAFVEPKGIGAGGAGGGAPATAAGNIGFGCGGNAGAYGEGRFTAAQVGASIIVTVGLGGVGAASGGGNGGASSFGSLMTLGGGAGGPSVGNTAPPLNAGNGGALAQTSGANLLPGVGGISTPGTVLSTAIGLSGQGANTLFGSGGGSNNNTGGGSAATGFGSGGGGAMAFSANATARIGGNGARGFLLIKEYA